jgi:hypothetical protein
LPLQWGSVATYDLPTPKPDRSCRLNREAFSAALVWAIARWVPIHW